MDKKKLTSVLSAVGAFAVALVMFLISNHNIKTARKMHDQLSAGVTEITRLTSELAEAGQQGGKPQMLTYVREHKPQAVAAANKIRAVCDYYEKLRVPSALRSKLSAIRASIPGMRVFLDSFEGIFKEVMLESELKSAVFTANLSAESPSVKSFILSEQAFISEMEHLDWQRKGGLVWL